MRRILKEIDPYVILVHKEFEKLQGLTNDELRDKTADLKVRILAGIADNQEEIRQLRENAEKEEDVYLKEEIYNKIDKLEKNIEEKLEGILDEHLPEAFAIVKETARRFKENSVLEVTARQYDRDLAATRESITINGDKALWSNKWIAGGNEITWDMVHYDVQLIGGVALHKGKLPKWQPVKEKQLLPHFRFFLMHLPEEVYILLLLTIISQNVTLNGWGQSMNSMVLLLIVSINISPIHRIDVKHIMQILLLEQIMNLVLTT